MINQVVLLGRIYKEIKEEKENDKIKCIITLAVPRSYKNEDGIYDTDFIECTLWNGIAQNTAEYCKQGDLVGIKGTIKTTDGKIEIIAEKVSFLSSKKEE